MASNLPDSKSKSWNIENNFDDAYQAKTQTSSMFPMHSFSSFGGGDAPLLTNMPRVRSQLFTISTRAVMASHTQLSVKYPASTGGSHEIPSSPSSIDSDIEDVSYGDSKPLNTDVSQLNRSATPLVCYPPLRNDPQEEGFTNYKRCIHGSFEDIRVGQNPNHSGPIIANRRKSAPAVLENSRSEMTAAANELLVEENRHLLRAIQGLKRKLVLTKVAVAFTMKAVKRRGKAIEEIDAVRQEKEIQCAARLILHSMLLNSWRNTRKELDIRLADNTDLKKSLENYTLQVQVLRHVQNSERQKSQEKATLIQSLSNEVKVLKAENQTMRKEVEKMENQLNSLQASTQNLVDENSILAGELKGISEKKEKLAHSLEWERSRSEQLSKENSTLKETLKTLDVELKDASEQKTHWQERARCSESEVWELQLHLQTKDGKIKELQTSCESLRSDKMDLIDIKSKLKTNLDQTTITLQMLSEKNDVLAEKYETLREEREAKINYINELERKLESAKKEFSEIEKELLSYKLQNVRKRRDWGNALYFIVSPMDAMRRRTT